MTEAAASGCIDYTQADSRDPKFLLKEVWICKQMLNKRLQEVAKEQLSLRRQLVTLTEDGFEDYKSLYENFSTLVMPWQVAVPETDAERYKQVFSDVTPEDTQKLEDHLNKLAIKHDQERETRELLAKKADALIANNFTHRIK